MNNQLIDNNTYNIIMALASNLEAHEAYRKYANDGNEQLWNQLARHAQEAVNLLQQALPAAMGQLQDQSQNPQQFATSSEQAYSNTGGADYSQTEIGYGANKVTAPKGTGNADISDADGGKMVRDDG